MMVLNDDGIQRMSNNIIWHFLTFNFDDDGADAFSGKGQQQSTGTEADVTQSRVVLATRPERYH